MFPTPPKMTHEYVGFVVLVGTAHREQKVRICWLKKYTKIPKLPNTAVNRPYVRKAPSYPRNVIKGVTAYEVPKLNTPRMAQMTTSAGPERVG